ncbi:MAG: AIR synthase [Bacillota bacterium]|nr:MAG: AIR synthase [Bacillota bacterium]
MSLKAGKLPPDLLRRQVLSRRGRRRPEVIVPAALGEDSTVLDLGGDLCVASVDPITGAGSDIGWLAVHVSCNDVAAHGARPVAVLLAVMVPEGSGLDVVEAIMEGAQRAAAEVGIEIAGGHTEVTPGLPQPLVTATVIGRAPRDRVIRSAGMRPGDRIWMSKTAGLEGTAILAADLEAVLRGRLEPAVLEQARALGSAISVVPEALAAAAAGAPALHDVPQGGGPGAPWEVAAAPRRGPGGDAGGLPRGPATAALCGVLGADPLRLISSGVLLAAAPEGVDLAAAGREAGTMFTPVARALPAGDGCWVLEGSRRRPLDPPDSDELWRVKARFGEVPS